MVNKKLVDNGDRKQLAGTIASDGTRQVKAMPLILMTLFFIFLFVVSCFFLGYQEAKIAELCSLNVAETDLLNREGKIIEHDYNVYMPVISYSPICVK